MKRKAVVYLSGLAGLLLVLGCSTNPPNVPVNIESGSTRAIPFVESSKAISTNAADPYESDDSQYAAKPIAVDGSIQEHNFFDDGTDWMKLSAIANTTYTLETWVLGDADTIITVYDGSTQKGSNDDKANGDCGSKLIFKPTVSKTYTLKVTSYNNKTGANRGYNLSITTTALPPPPVTLPQPRKKWTVMVYLDGDNNLSSHSSQDMEEMKTVGSTNDFNIVVLWDNASSTHGYYYVQNGNETLLSNIGEPNMGNPLTAKNFINFAATNFPADNYLWIYWNHGGAVDRGVCWDDSNNNDHLSEVEQKDIMKYAVSRLGKPFEVVGFDACLMATAEIFYQYRSFAKYLCASEEMEPYDGWDYAFLNTIKDNPAVTGADVAKAIADTYAAYYSTSSDVTLSVANLSYASALGTAIHDFAQAAMNSGVPGSTYKSCASSLTSFSGYTKDMVAFLNNVIASSAIPQNVKDKALALKALITTQLIIQNWCSSDWSGKAYGCSITMKADTTTYSKLDICINTAWDEFCTFAGFSNY